jgi:hypothetical protein
LPITELFKTFALFSVAQTFVWFQCYSHYIWVWWEGKPIHAAIIYGIPASILFWYGTRLAVDTTGAAWTARMLGFGSSYFTFPVLTWWLLGESMFTPKTMICIFLSFLIIGVQLFWR